MEKIGITERGDPAFDLSADEWILSGKPAIVITKNFSKVHERLGSRSNILYHATITGMGGTFYEPGVMPSATQLIYIKDNIPDEYKSHVVIRIDPIIPNQVGLINACEIYRFAEDNGFKTRISILDMYNHVKDRLVKVSEKSTLIKKVCENLINSYSSGIHYPFENRKELVNLFFPNSQVCGEPGIESSGCISKEVF